MHRLSTRAHAPALLAVACALACHPSFIAASTPQPALQPKSPSPPPPSSPGASAPKDDLARLAAQLRREEVRIRVLRITSGGPAQRVEARAAVKRQWLAATPWSPVDAATHDATAMMEYRTGPRASVLLEVDDAGLIELRPLTRARVLRVSVDDARASARRVVIELGRGKVDVRPEPGRSVNVQTPDGIVVVREPVRVSYDAVRGVKVAPLPPPASPRPAPETQPPPKER